MAVWLTVAAALAFANTEEFFDDLSGPSGAIINKYLKATQAGVAKQGAVEVDIDASVPNLNQHGRLKALRMISDVGKITYRVLGFQGDNAIKSQVIGRYLQAEQQTQNDPSMTVTPVNYKFKFKGSKVDDSGNARYVFQLVPRKKRMGLFKGELWLDARTCRPVVEKGRLVKNPSIFFRKVDFERDFAVQDGSAVPVRMSSTIDTRLVGRVNLSINYVAVAEDVAESTHLSNGDLP